MEDTRKMITVSACGESRQYPAGITFGEIADDYQDRIPLRILLVKRDDNELRELSRRADRDCSLSFVTLADKEGRDTYRRSLCLMMLKAFRMVLHEDVHVWIRFAVSKGLFCTLHGGHVVPDEELLQKVLVQMRELRDRAIPFRKCSMNTKDAVRLFYDNRMYDKAKLFRYRISSRTNVYNLDGLFDYYYGYMVRDTSCLQLFDLKPYGDGFVLMMPDSAMRSISSI